MSHSRLRRAAAAVLAAAFAVVSAAGCGSKSARTSQSNPAEKEGVTLRIGFPGTGSGGQLSGPEGWANQRGLLLPILKPLGVTKVQLVPLPNGPDVNEAIAAKGVDIGLFGDAPAVVGRGVGIPSRVISIRSIDGNSYLYTRADGPKTVEDLRGKTVGTQKGSVMARFLTGVLDEKKILGQVKIVHLPSNIAEAAVRRGDIDAYAGGYGPLEETRGFRVIDEAKNHPSLANTGLAVVREDFLKAHPGFAAAWSKVRIAGIDDIQAHQKEYYQSLADRAKLPLDVYKKLYPATVYIKDDFPKRGLEQLSGTKDFLKRQGLLKQDFKIEDWIYREGGAKIAHS